MAGAAYWPALEVQGEPLSREYSLKMGSATRLSRCVRRLAEHMSAAETLTGKRPAWPSVSRRRDRRLVRPGRVGAPILYRLFRLSIPQMGARKALRTTTVRLENHGC